MSDAPLASISPARAAQELTKLSAERTSGAIAQDVYEHKFSRMISESKNLSGCVV